MRWRRDAADPAASTHRTRRPAQDATRAPRKCHHGVMGSSQHRVSARVAGITESATLAVDAKAKALKAAGRPVIGFRAGEPGFPPPAYIAQAAPRGRADPRFRKAA